MGIPGARVDFCIYNYAEFYPAMTKYTDDSGKVTISAGLGDMLVWAALGERNYAWCKASFGKDKTVVLDVSWNGNGPTEMTIVPPAEKAKIPEVTPEQRAENDRRFAREDSLRHAYEATFPTHEEALAFVQEQGYGHHLTAPILASRGNWETIEDFMPISGNHERVEQVLTALSGKDLKDAPLEILQDYYMADAFLGARVENEFLTPFYSYFRENFRERIDTPGQLVQWVREHITVLDSPRAWNIPMSPKAVFESRLALPRSRDIFFVSLARALGFEAQKDPVTGKVQYRKENDWLDVHFDGAAAVKAPTGILRLDYTPTRAIPNPTYYSHFTISKMADGRPKLLTFDEGEVDMGGGMDWEHAFRDGYPLEEGRYLLVSGNRSPDGSVPVKLQFFTIQAGETKAVPLVIREQDGKVAVIGSFDAETLYTQMPDQVGHDEMHQSVLSAVGRGYYALAVLDPGKEPTNHVLRDLSAERERLEAWGRPILLLCETEGALALLQAEIAAGRYGELPENVLFGIDTDGIAASLGTRLPIVLLADSFNRLFYISEGYTIGLGTTLCDLIARL
ncbi:MAG: transglutaminase domain-containing protein, partial [Bacteroidota bacterium]|nr:transglutaminase domain-containing protein [Bacteroidota bacterium]